MNQAPTPGDEEVAGQAPPARDERGDTDQADGPQRPEPVEEHEQWAEGVGQRVEEHEEVAFRLREVVEVEAGRHHERERDPESQPVARATTVRLLRCGAEGRVPPAGRGVRRRRAPARARPRLLRRAQSIAVTPPSTTMAWPVTNVASSDSRKRATRAISSGRPMRPSTDDVDLALPDLRARDAREHRRVDVPRADRVGADAERAEARRERTGEPDQPGLRRAVRGDREVAEHRLDRRDADDRRSFVRAQVVEQQLGDARVRGEVHREHGVPVGPVDAADGLRDDDPRGVDQPADRRELGPRGVDRGSELVAVGDVDRDADRGHAQRIGPRSRRPRHRRRSCPTLRPDGRPPPSASAVARPIPEAPPVTTTPVSTIVGW